MITKRLKELESAKARLAKLEKNLAHELQRELAALPAVYGYSSLRGFIDALTGAAAGGRSGRAPKAGKAPAARSRRRRAVITDATRAEVKKLAGAGKTGAEIAKTLKISLPSVQNIKKALGLVKSRK